MMSGFFERVYRLVRLVPPGKVTSYGAIARMLGQPHAARTVGWALHSLPEGSDVPWHRVINSQGRVSTRRQDRDSSLPTQRPLSLQREARRPLPTQREAQRPLPTQREAQRPLQRTLLEDEGIEFDQHGRVDWDRFGWAEPPWPEVEVLIHTTARSDPQMWDADEENKS
jgi:O-6-methylguanine DNA methyltransferase